MRLVHAHFPINVAIPKDGTAITVKNFLGGKQDKFIPMLADTRIRLCTEVKDQLIVDGNDLSLVSLVCAQIRQVCRIGRKDERKFLDGIFVSKKEFVDPRPDAE